MSNIVYMQGVQQRPDRTNYRVAIIDGIRTEIPYTPSWNYEIRGTSFLTESGEIRIRVLRVDAYGNEKVIA